MERFHFRGFDPVEPVRSKANQAYERVLEAAPSDAHVVAALDWNGEYYSCSFEVGSFAWPMAVSKSHRDPLRAVDRAEDAILRKIARWKELRLSALRGVPRQLAEAST